MFVHISPEVDAIGETISTLKFAERVATVELGAARLNKESGEVKELKEQIASLRIALARKDGEAEDPSSTFTPDILPKTKIRGPSPVHSNRQGGRDSSYLSSPMLSPDISRMKARGPSPVHSNRQGVDISGGHNKHRQPMEEVGNIENPAFRQRRPSLDLQELLMATNPSLWPDSSPRVESQKGDDRDTSSGEWVDKVMVNKQEMNGLDNQLRHWQANNGSLPEFFYQSYLPDMKSLSGQQYSRREGYQYENGTTDDELEVATSDSSEAADVLSTFSFPKYSSAPTGGGSKIKKSHLKPSKSPDLRNSSPANGLSQPRKLANGGGQSFNKRQQVSNNIDGKRNGKAGGGK